MKKKIIIIILVLLFLIAGISIYLGIYFTKLSKPTYIVGECIDKIDAGISNYIKKDDKYNVGDSYTIKSNLDFDLESEDYLKKSKTDPEYLKKYNMIKNLSITKNDISIIQNKKSKKLLYEVHSTLDKEKIFDYKKFIENATKYYYLEDVQKKYVNDGTDNYFEMYDEETDTLGNIEYLHQAFVNALKASLEEEYFESSPKTITIDNKNVNANQIYLRIDDKLLHTILNDTISNLKKDEKANKILTSLDSDFSKYKIKNSKRLLDKQESYTVNIYTSKYRNKVLKYEVIHLKGDEKKTYIYEGNLAHGNFYYIEDDSVIYNVEVNNDNKVLESKIKDSTNKELGIFKIEKNDNSVYYTFNFDDKKTKYDIIYSSKFNKVKANKSYTNEKKLSFKHIENKVSIMSGTITLTSEITNKAKIAEDTSEAVLSSTLSEEQKDKYKNKQTRLEERLKK